MTNGLRPGGRVVRVGVACGQTFFVMSPVEAELLCHPSGKFQRGSDGPAATPEPKPGQVLQSHKPLLLAPPPPTNKQASDGVKGPAFWQRMPIARRGSVALNVNQV